LGVSFLLGIITDMELEYNFDEIEKVARKIKSKIKAGDIVGFSGQLAAGKTTLISRIVENFGYKGRVSSPTFVIEHRYPTDGTKKVNEIIHIDLYRLAKDDLRPIDWQEYLANNDKIIFIEWPERLEGEYLQINKQVKIEIINDKKRKITLRESTGN